MKMLKDSPSLGAYFASRPPLALTRSPDQLNIYAVPASITLALLLVETAYLSLTLPETRSWRKSIKPATGRESKAVKTDATLRRQRLKVIGRLHGIFLLLFSGVCSQELPTSVEARLTCVGRVHSHIPHIRPVSRVECREWSLTLM